ncbi:MAG TPA: BTAD domain-containing putative transcriptional regulator, partial [Ilumatobacteraceae bacterium]|nr:BTAD domain-containing putative transcriptional regulator [Ilumatobacteraceae bacterium]
MVLVRLLGPVEMVDSRCAVRRPDSALRRTLLALLALRAGEVLSTDWLLEHAWAGEPPESGLGALRFHVSRLRRELGADGLIETRPGGYRLVVSAEDVDALAVAAAAQAARVEADPACAADMYAEMLARWRGAPFVDASACSILDDEAARLDELRLAITEEYFRARLDSGAGREVVADLVRIVRDQPLRESLWTMLIMAQYRAGLQADALASYQQMRAMFTESLGLDPSSELRELEHRILRHDPSLLGTARPAVDLGPAERPAASTRPHANLPEPASSLIDTEDQVGAAWTVLRDHRLVTLTGPGGVGKSRLAVEVGRASRPGFDGGVWLIELASADGPDAVVSATAAALAIRLQPGVTLLDAIIDWLTGRQLLMILDNCEHLLGQVAELVADVLARCPTVKILATSRAPLEVPGERVHQVRPLDPAVDGVTLFLERAAAADSSLVTNELDRDVVTGICRRLDGLPLAIELAAARIRSIDHRRLLALLDDRFELLRVGRGGGGHHETLLATVEWSYRLLGDRERTVFDCLAAFAGGFDLVAAAAVCGDDVIDEMGVVDALGRLVDHSMVVAEHRPDGIRYHLLETLRHFAVAQLEARGEAETVRRRHLHHYADVAERADSQFRTADELIGASVLEQDWDNLRTAHDTAILDGDLEMAERLIAATWLYAESQNRLEHGEWADRTIEFAPANRQPSPDTFARAGWWADMREEDARAQELIRRGLEQVPDPDDARALLCVCFQFPMPDPHHPLYSDPIKALDKLERTLDLDRDWWLLLQLVDHGSRLDPASGPRLLARLVEIAQRIRAPRLMVEADLALAKASISNTPPDFIAAHGLATRATHTAVASGNLVPEADSRRI